MPCVQTLCLFYTKKYEYPQQQQMGDPDRNWTNRFNSITNNKVNTYCYLENTP